MSVISRRKFVGAMAAVVAVVFKKFRLVELVLGFIWTKRIRFWRSSEGGLELG